MGGRRLLPVAAMKYAGSQHAARAAVLDEEQAANPTPDDIRAMHDHLLTSYAAILLLSSRLPAVFSQERCEVESRRLVRDLGPIWGGSSALINSL